MELARQALHHRGALQRPMDIEWAQGRRRREDLHPAGAAGDRAEPRRPHHPALRAQGHARRCSPRAQHRPAHRRRHRARDHATLQRDGARAARRRAGRGHDRPGLGAGHEARRRHRHQPRRPHLPRGHHRARAGHPGGGGLRRCHQAHPDGQEVTVSCAEGDTGYVYEGTAGVRAQADRARHAAGDPGARS